jgi:hypothetical protein
MSAYDLSSHTNTLAVASLVTSLCGVVLCGFPALVGAIMGHVARKQIRQRVAVAGNLMQRVDAPLEDSEAMRRIMLPLLTKRNGVALAGIIVGWTAFVLWLGFWVPFAWGFFGAAIESTP